jgi:hypothetical protein
MVAVVIFIGCGKSGSNDVAVEVGNHPITAATVTHWMSVVAGEGSLPAGQPFPHTPDPPSYSTCIAYYERFPLTLATKSSQPDRPALKRACEVEYQKERIKALYFLISYEWVNGEASELGVKLPDGAAEREVSLLKSKLPGPALKKFLVGSRGSSSDLLMRIRLELLAKAIQERLEKDSGASGLSPQQHQHALSDFGRRFLKQWSAKTACHSGYVVPICKGYTAPKTPPAVTPPGIPLTTMNAGSSTGELALPG